MPKYNFELATSASNKTFQIHWTR